jgi:hypothetical protein
MSQGKFGILRGCTAHTLKWVACEVTVIGPIKRLSPLPASAALPSTVRSGSDHRFIPPKRKIWQSDVETVHSLVEDAKLEAGIGILAFDP